jgi:hypothetical protein
MVLFFSSAVYIELLFVCCVVRSRATDGETKEAHGVTVTRYFESH